MFTQKTLAAAAAIALLPMAAFAGEFSASAGAEASISYDDDFDKTGDDLELTLGGAFAEGGFSAGADLTWNSSAATDEIELALSLGYAGSISDATGYSVSLTGYWYNDTDYGTTEAEFGLSHAFTDTIEGAYTLTYDIEAETADNSIELSIAVGDWSVNPVVGIDGADDVYTELNFGYDFGNGFYAGIEFANSDAPGVKMSTTVLAGYAIDLM